MEPSTVVRLALTETAAHVYGFSGVAVLIQFHWRSSAKLKEEKHGQEWWGFFFLGK